MEYFPKSAMLKISYLHNDVLKRSKSQFTDIFIIWWGYWKVTEPRMYWWLRIIQSLWKCTAYAFSSVPSSSLTPWDELLCPTKPQRKITHKIRGKLQVGYLIWTIIDSNFIELVFLGGLVSGTSFDKYTTY